MYNTVHLYTVYHCKVCTTVHSLQICFISVHFRCSGETATFPAERRKQFSDKKYFSRDGRQLRTFIISLQVSPAANRWTKSLSKSRMRQWRSCRESQSKALVSRPSSSPSWATEYVVLSLVKSKTLLSIPTLCVKKPCLKTDFYRFYRL